MADVRPFTALRPLPQLAHHVAAPPYDVVDAEEAAAIMLAAPDSFLHVTRPDADPALVSGDAVDAGADGADGADRADAEERWHERGREALGELVRRGVLVREPGPALWVYRQQVGGGLAVSGVRPGATQTGIVALAAVTDYDDGVIRVHEHTRPDKENERARHLDVLDAHDEPVVLFHRDGSDLAAVVAEVTAGEHDLAVTTPDHIWHTLWAVREPRVEARIVRAFAALDRLYVADGHHRTAAAARLAAARRGLAPVEAGEADAFLAVVFPADELTVLPYHRLVLTADDDVLDRLAAVGGLDRADGPVQPRERGTIGVRTAAGWHRLVVSGGLPPEGGVEGLAVSLLQDRVLGPVLGIDDPRRDPRLDFVGGPDGLAVLDDAVGSGRAAVGFALAPTALGDLVAVSDRGEVMPPKSTWFFPKPASGLLVHPLH